MGGKNAEGALIFETRGLCKNFGPTVALDHVDFKVYRGQITGLIGENGSGKSTITSIAAGMQPPTSGEMFFNGKPHKPSSMIEGAKLGIGMIVQEQGTISGITVAQNIFLGEEDQFRTMGLINRSKMNAAAKKALEDIGYTQADPSALIDTLNFQDRKLVEIAKVVYNQPEMLVVDETTTALSQSGRTIVYNLMKKMRDENKAVVFISHDLEELIEICDTLTVLRDGVLITTLDRSEMAPDTIKKYMVGREMKGQYYRSDYGEKVSRDVVLEARQVTSGTGMLMNFSMEVYQGEILGIGGLSHCGMHELGKVLFGDEKLLTGEVIHKATGEKITSPLNAMKHGLGYVSKDRDRESLVLTAAIKDNIISASYDKIAPKGFMKSSDVRSFVDEQVQSLSIKCASVIQDVQYLSGGNKQKVVFGKWIGRNCDILILDCPTRGVDIGVKASMYQLIYEMKRQGKTIIMISEELPELIGMSDRLLILKNGQLAGEFFRSPQLSENEIIEVMI
ncbi:MAG TPA: sugar ABC transporter ATP-binding protein [Candidatus Scybalocola faecigallinarum]|uniref:Sugar ABC transporter ATP-binding protein n=1 Tax=Candidatus Scybalocola faecigallinarum TaxID=2840941 RepID=A0A9D1JRW0_9FIRM|nr:sugar ABC transporter ATP-binding protein [Candidatus Scybalocola faecigallinarum]